MLPPTSSGELAFFHTKKHPEEAASNTQFGHWFSFSSFEQGLGLKYFLKYLGQVHPRPNLNKLIGVERLGPTNTILSLCAI